MPRKKCCQCIPSIYALGSCMLTAGETRAASCFITSALPGIISAFPGIKTTKLLIYHQHPLQSLLGLNVLIFSNSPLHSCKAPLLLVLMHHSANTFWRKHNAVRILLLVKYWGNVHQCIWQVRKTSWATSIPSMVFTVSLLLFLFFLVFWHLNSFQRRNPAHWICWVFKIKVPRGNSSLMHYTCALKTFKIKHDIHFQLHISVLLFQPFMFLKLLLHTELSQTGFEQTGQRYFLADCISYIKRM